MKTRQATNMNTPGTQRKGGRVVSVGSESPKREDWNAGGILASEGGVESWVRRASERGGGRGVEVDAVANEAIGRSWRGDSDFGGRSGCRREFGGGWEEEEEDQLECVLNLLQA